MKHLGNEIKRLIDEKRLVKKDIADALGYTPTGLSAILRKESIDCALLVKICEIIGVSPASFFCDGADYVKPAPTAKEYETLLQLLNEKERTIQILLAKNGTKTGQND